MPSLPRPCRWTGWAWWAEDPCHKQRPLGHHAGKPAAREGTGSAGSQGSGRSGDPKGPLAGSPVFCTCHLRACPWRAPQHEGQASLWVPYLPGGIIKHFVTCERRRPDKSRILSRHL